MTDSELEVPTEYAYQWLKQAIGVVIVGGVINAVLIFSSPSSSVALVSLLVSVTMFGIIGYLLFHRVDEMIQQRISEQIQLDD